MKFSILVLVCEKTDGLVDCLCSVQQLNFPAKEIETLLVGSKAALASTHGSTSTGNASVGTASQPIGTHATLTEAIQVAQGEFVAIVDSDTIVHPDWLSRIDAVAEDATVGCFAGDILPIEQDSPIEKVLAGGSHLTQRWAVAGWHFKPYALVGNAIYRKSALEDLPPMILNAFDGAATTLAWRMLDSTDFRIRFVPDAIVYRRALSSLEDLWSHFRSQGRRHVNWCTSQPEYSLPSVARLEEAAYRAFGELLDSLKGVAANESTVEPALKAAMHTALLSGQARRMIETTSHGSPTDSVAESCRGRDTRCCICDCTRFVPGPRGRMVGTIAPQCAECASLERHRVLRVLLSTLDTEESRKWSAITVGEALHPKLRVFHQHQHSTLDELAAGRHSPMHHDVVVATFAFSRFNERPIEDVLSLITYPLKDAGILVLVDLPSIAKSRNNHEYAVESELEHAISAFLPNVTVRRTWAIDHVTEEAFTLTIAAQDANRVLRLISKFCKAQLFGDQDPSRIGRFARRGPPEGTSGLRASA